MPPRGAGLAVAVAAAVVAWNLVYLWMLLPDGRSWRRYRADCARRRRPGLRPVPGQAGAGRPGTAGRLAGLDLADRVVHRASRSSSSWASPAAAAATVAVCAAFVAGAAASPGLTVWDGVLAGGGGWMAGRGGPRAGCCGCCCSARARGRPPDAGAVRRRARRRDRRRPPVRAARALGHRARHLGEHAAHDRPGCGARHRGVAARPGAARHRACWTARATARRTRTPPRSRWNPRCARWPAPRACASRSTARRA